MTKPIERLMKYDAVNEAASLEELAEVIHSFAKNGLIQISTGTLNAELSTENLYREQYYLDMASGCRNFTLDNNRPTILTRMYGIRQQAYMLYAQGKFKKK